MHYYNDAHVPVRLFLQVAVQVKNNITSEIVLYNIKTPLVSITSSLISFVFLIAFIILQEKNDDYYFYNKQF
jgi:hypothetical protein